VRSLAARENANATWYIYLSGTQYAFVNLQTLEALTMGDDEIYVTQTTTGELADASTLTPTAAQAEAQVSGYVATSATYNSYSPTAETLFNVETDMESQTTELGSPEVVLYCPCCTTGGFDTFKVGNITSPKTFTTDTWKTYNADQCYVESVSPSDLVYDIPKAGTGTVTVGVKPGKSVSTNSKLIMGCCYTGTKPP
jgi:hypothetical protein